jgi:hypothetical protein
MPIHDLMSNKAGVVPIVGKGTSTPDPDVTNEPSPEWKPMEPQESEPPVPVEPSSDPAHHPQEDNPFAEQEAARAKAVAEMHHTTSVELMPKSEAEARWPGITAQDGEDATSEFSKQFSSKAREVTDKFYINRVPHYTVTFDLDRLDQIAMPGTMFRVTTAGTPIGKPIGPRESALVLEWLASIGEPAT